MKPLTRTQTTCALLVMLGLYCYVSNHDYDTLYVEQIMEQARQDELAKPRLELVSMQEDADKLLALQEVK